VDERISCLCIKGKFFNCSLINIYAPTEEKCEDEKEAFYMLLEKTYDSCPRNDIKIILGDKNAQIGKEDIYYPTIGKCSLHDHNNDNGQRLTNFAASKGVVVPCFLTRRYIKLHGRLQTGKP
jgi:exonuclease III